MKAFLAAVGVVALFIGLAVWFETCHVAGTVVDSANGVIDKTLDSNNVIYNYEFFKQSYQDIQALTAKIADADKAANTFDAQFKSRKEMDRDDKQESDRLHAIVSGLQQERQTEVATYNARSQMANRNIFKTNDVPNHIE
jgi:hypothetical protein